MHKYSFLLLLTFLIGCISPPKFADEIACKQSDFRGVFILNEGDFNQNNATLSFWDEEKKELACQDIFEAVNQKKLGSVANATVQDADTLYILMTGSQLVYKLQLPSFQLISELKFPSGFYLQDVVQISAKKMYVSAFNVAAKQYKIFIVNPTAMELIGEINIEPFPYKMNYRGGKVFVACGNYPNKPKNNKVAIIDAETNLIEGYIQLPKENPTQVLTYEDKLIVLCAGNYVNSDSECVVSIINRLNYEIEKNVYFSGSAYQIKLVGDYLLGIRDADDATSSYSGTSIFKIDLQTLELTSNFLKDSDFKERQTGDFLYKLQYDEANGNVYVAFSTSHKGFIINPFGNIIDHFEVGDYPNSIVFYR